MSPINGLSSVAPQALASKGDPVRVGQDVESLFLSLMLKQMRQAGTENGLFPGDESDTFGGMFDLYMGQHLAESGGIGLADSFNLGRPQTGERT